MKTSQAKVFHPLFLIYLLNLFMWGFMLQGDFFTQIFTASILACISFIPSTILFGSVSYYRHA